MSSRTYSEKEAAELFRRAAEMQATDEHPDSPGLTLAELKRAGQAAGIAPAYLDRALSTPRASSHEPTRLLRFKTSVHRQRFVPHPIDEEAWGRIVRDLRDQLGGQGMTETLGGIHEWRRNPLRFIAEPVEGGTALRASASWHASLQWALSMVLGVPLILIVAWGESMGGDPKGPLLLGLLALMSATLLYFGLRGYVGKADRVGAKFDAALDRAAQRLTEADAASTRGVLAEPTEMTPAVAFDSDPLSNVQAMGVDRDRTRA